MGRVTIDTSALGCQVPGCKVSKPVYRHHKGNDKYLGLFNRNIARDYHKYEHVVKVCDKHHMEIHWLYMRYLTKHKSWLKSPRMVRVLWKKLIKVCDHVLAGRMTLEDPPLEFKIQWQKSRTEWLRNKAAKAAKRR